MSVSKSYEVESRYLPEKVTLLQVERGTLKARVKERACNGTGMGGGVAECKMSDCNARGREFKSWSGQNKFTKVMGSDGKL